MEADEILDAPMYIMETINHDNNKLKIIVVELPDDNLLSTLDFNMEFKPAISNQVYNMILNLNNIQNENKLEKDYDHILLSFIKHYKHRTQNIFITTDDNLIKKYTDELYTNNIINNLKPNYKYNLKILIFHSIKMINFAIYGNGKSGNVSRWEELQKLYLQKY